jgi:hypothetical protein
MRARILLCAALALIPLDRAAAGPQVSVTPIGVGAYRAMVRGRGVVLDEAQYAVEKKAALLCNRKKVEIGGYRYGQETALNSATSSQGVLTYTQDFRCVDKLASAAVISAPHNDKAVLAFTDRFLAARDGNDFDTALSMFDADTRRMADGWSGDAARFNDEAGARQARRIVGITWYDNPAAIARPGVYASVDYVGGYSNVPQDCGYLLWRTVDGQKFELVHEEHKFIPAGTIAKLSPAEIDAMKKKIGCAA